MFELGVYLVATQEFGDETTLVGPGHGSAVANALPFHIVFIYPCGLVAKHVPSFKDRLGEVVKGGWESLGRDIFLRATFGDSTADGLKLERRLRPVIWDGTKGETFRNQLWWGSVSKTRLPWDLELSLPCCQTWWQGVNQAERVVWGTRQKCGYHRARNI